MTAELKFIVLDDKAHVVGFSEHTACGLPIPIGEAYTFDQPKGLCTQCKKLTEDSDDYGVLKSVIEGNAPEPGTTSAAVDAAKDAQRAAAKATTEAIRDKDLSATEKPKAKSGSSK